MPNASVRGSIATTAETSSLLAPNASVPLRNCYDCSDIITVLAKRFRFEDGVSPVYIGNELFAMSSVQVATLSSSSAHWLHTRPSYLAITCAVSWGRLRGTRKSILGDDFWKIFDTRALFALENIALSHLPTLGAAITVCSQEHTAYIGVKLRAHFLAAWCCTLPQKCHCLLSTTAFSASLHDRLLTKVPRALSRQVCPRFFL